MTPTQVTKSIEKQFSDLKTKQNQFFSFQQELYQLKNKQNETTLAWQILPIIFCNNYLSCDVILYYWLQSVMWGKELIFLDTLAAISELEARYQAGEPLSEREKSDIKLFFSLDLQQILSEGDQPSPIQLLPTDLFAYIRRLNGDFFIRINLSRADHQSGWFIIYRKNNYFNVLNDNFIYVKNIKNIDNLMTIIHLDDLDLDSFLQIIPQVVNQAMVWPKIETEYTRLQNVDLLNGKLIVDNHPVSRALLYELGARLIRTKVNESQSWEISEQINTHFDLSQEAITNDLLERRMSISAENYLQFVEKNIKFPDKYFNASEFLHLNQIINKFQFTGDGEVKNRARVVNKIINNYEFVELANKLEDYFELNVKRIRRSMRRAFSMNKRIKSRDSFLLTHKNISIEKLEMSKLYWELCLSRATSEEFYLQLAELGYKYKVVPEIVKWTKDLKNYLGFKTYIASVITYKKITYWLSEFSYDSVDKYPIRQGFIGLLTSPFEIMRIIQGGYHLAVDVDISERDYRDNIATIFFSFASLSQSVINEMFNLSKEMMIESFSFLVGSEMIYKGLSELEEDKNYGLTFKENLIAYFLAAFSLPQTAQLNLLKQRIEQINSLKSKAKKILDDHPETVFIAALGQLVVKNTSPQQSDSIYVEIHRGKYFTNQEAHVEVLADYALIELNEKNRAAQESILSRLTPKIEEDNHRLICGPIYTYDPIYNPPGTGEKSATADYYCHNAFAVSNKNDNNLINMMFIYDLCLQNTGRVSTSLQSKKNIFFIKKGNQSIVYGNQDATGENIFFILDSFTGMLINRSYKVTQKNILDVSRLTNQWLGFSEGKLYLDENYATYFTPRGINYFRGRVGLDDEIDCANSTFQFVSTFGGTALVGDNIKNCPKANNLGAYNTLRSNREGRHIYYVSHADKFIKIDEHIGSIELYFQEHDLLHENDFFYHIKGNYLEIREKKRLIPEEYLVLIKNYGNPEQKNKIMLFDKYVYLLRPVLGKVEAIVAEDSSGYLQVKNFIYQTRTNLVDNQEVLDEYFARINYLQGIGILGIITQIKENKKEIALKIIGSDTIHVVLPLGQRELDFVYGGMGIDIYYLTLADLEATKILSTVRTIHISNLSFDHVIDNLVVPVTIQELILKKDLNNLVIYFSSYSQLTVVIDNYLLDKKYQHLLLIDKLGKEWIVKLKDKINVSLIAYYRNLVKQLNYPLILQTNELVTFAIQGTFTDCLYYKDNLGLILECIQENNFPLEIPLFHFCQPGKPDLKLWASVGGQLIDEDQRLDFVDCQTIQEQASLAFLSASALKKKVKETIYYELAPNKKMIIPHDSSQKSTAKHFLIQDTVYICQIILQRRQDLVFTFTDEKGLLLGYYYVQNWNKKHNRISVIENNELYIDQLENWRLEDRSAMQTSINSEFLQAYLKKKAFTALNQHHESFEELEALLLILATFNVKYEGVCSEEKINNQLKIYEKIKLILHRNLSYKKAFIYLLLRICVTNDLLCKKQLDEIVSCLSLTAEDLAHLKSLIMYTTLLLKKLTAYHYRALDAMVTLAVSSGSKTRVTPLSQRTLDCQEIEEKSVPPLFSEALQSNLDVAQEAEPALTNLPEVRYHAQQKAVHYVAEEKRMRDKTGSRLVSSWLERSQDWLFRHRATLAMGSAAIGGSLAMAWGFITWRFAPRHRRCFHAVSKLSVFFSVFKPPLAQAVEVPFADKSQKSPLTCLTKLSEPGKTNTDQSNLDFLEHAPWESQANLLFLDYLIRRTWTGKRDTPPLGRYSSARQDQEQLTELAAHFKKAINTSQKRGWGGNESANQSWITRQSDSHTKRYCAGKR